MKLYLLQKYLKIAIINIDDNRKLEYILKAKQQKEIRMSKM